MSSSPLSGVLGDSETSRVGLRRTTRIAAEARETIEPANDAGRITVAVAATVAVGVR